MRARTNRLDAAKFVRSERAAWGSKNLLAPNASTDFQKLADEAFFDLRAEYFRPIDLVTEMLARKMTKPNAKWSKRNRRKALPVFPESGSE